MTEQLPLIEGFELYASEVKPRREAFYVMFAWHGSDRRWKLFPDLWPATDEEFVKAREFGERLSACWTAWRIWKVVVE